MPQLSIENWGISLLMEDFFVVGYFYLDRVCV